MPEPLGLRLRPVTDDDGAGSEQTVYPVVYDIPNWSELDWFTAANEVTTALEQKGFCFINGFADEKVGRYAQKEAKILKRADMMKRTPEEAAPALLGPSCSCSTFELASPVDEPPESEEYLRQIDQCLDDVGMAIARGSGSDGVFGEMMGRTPGVVHYSRTPEDREAPPLADMEEAAEYISKASMKKIVLLYYLGPSATMFGITPREDAARTYCVMTGVPVVLAYRHDICCVQQDSKGLAITLEVDFPLRCYAGPLMAHRDMLPIPKSLNDWYMDHLRAISDMDSDAEGIPLQYQREAALHYHKSAPVRIASLWHELPTLPFLGGGIAPFEATLLGGQDPVTEVCRPRDDTKTGARGNRSIYSWGGKWDPDAYYDPEPEAGSFKMYTRHMAVINRNHPFDWDYSMKEFGILAEEDVTLDHRARMLLESTTGCLKSASYDLDDLAGKDVGFFVGMSGENQSWCFMQGEAKIDQFSAQNQSAATTVNRLSYYFRSNGPCFCIDTEESAGLVAMDTAVQNLRQSRCGPFSFASSCHWIANPFETIVQCASNSLSRSGRTRVWDQSADGFTKGEGVVTLLLELQQAEDDAGRDDARALVLGTGLNSKGSSSSLTAPSAPSLVDVVQRAAKDSSKSFYLCDAVEVNASGRLIADLVEQGTLQKLLGTKGAAQGDGTQAVAARAAKAAYGSTGPVCGLVAVARSCALLGAALHGPTLHLRQLQDVDMLSDEEGAPEQRMQILTEAIEARASTQIVGVSSFGATGTNCHGMLWGCKPRDEMKPRLGRPISWWPGGVQKETNPPMRGYYIVGTWSAWQSPVMMEEEADGVYGYTLVMGENNWECFQIWLDEDPERALHPGTTRATKDVKVEGPNGAGQHLSWMVSGKSEAVRLINESQAAALRAALEEAIEKGEESPPEPEPRCLVVMREDNLPKGHEHAKDVSDMPVVDLNASSTGKPGDIYRVRLHARGKYKRLEWRKLPAGFEAEVAPVAFEHKYSVIGDHSYWTFEEMTPSETEEGLHSFTLQLLREKSSFQIYRDSDFEQGFYPSATSSEASVKILGPDEEGLGKNWQICGKVGDHFRIDFRRLFKDGEDQRTMNWDFVSSGEVDLEEMAKSHQYYYVSSATGFQSSQEMRKSEDGKRFTQEVTWWGSGVEQFQILLHGNFLAAVHPPVSDATCHDELPLEGPDDDGADKYWAIGLHPKDQFEPGTHILVHLDIEGGLPRRVWWEKHDTPESHCEYLAWGCRTIFERHCRMLGFVPASEEYGPPKTIGRADFMDPEITGGVKGETTQLAALME